MGVDLVGVDLVGDTRKAYWCVHMRSIFTRSTSTWSTLSRSTFYEINCYQLQQSQLLQNQLNSWNQLFQLLEHAKAWQVLMGQLTGFDQCVSVLSSLTQTSLHGLTSSKGRRQWPSQDSRASGLETPYEGEGEKDTDSFWPGDIPRSNQAPYWTLVRINVNAFFISFVSWFRKSWLKSWELNSCE